MDEVDTLGLLLKATNFAAIKHKDQLRKDGKTPYINHPIGVAYILWKEGDIKDIEVLQVIKFLLREQLTMCDC